MIELDDPKDYCNYCGEECYIINMQLIGGLVDVYLCDICAEKYNKKNNKKTKYVGVVIDEWCWQNEDNEKLLDIQQKATLAIT